MPGKSYRGWCFTINNPVDGDAEGIEYVFFETQARYAIWQRERGDEGTEHLQGYILFCKEKSFKFVKDCLPRAHLEFARGTSEQNIAYCSKDSGRLAGPWELGDRPAPGKRSDLVEIQAKLDGGANLTSISQEHFSSFVRYHRSFQAYRLLNLKPRNWEMDIEVVYGSTGSGKSRYCLETYPDAWWKSKNSGQQQFWDGYQGEDTIIIDEFYGWLSWDYLLRLLDRYPFSLDTKHGTVQCTARKIVLTSNKHPKDWYTRPSYPWDDTNPLKRRIRSIRQLGVDAMSSSPSQDFKCICNQETPNCDECLGGDDPTGAHCDYCLERNSCPGRGIVRRIMHMTLNLNKPNIQRISEEFDWQKKKDLIGYPDFK